MTFSTFFTIEYRYAVSRLLKCYAECRQAQCHHAKCRGAAPDPFVESDCQCNTVSAFNCTIVVMYLHCLFGFFGEKN